MNDRIRIFRLLTYSGPRQQVKETLQKSQIGSHFSTPAGLVINSVLLGVFPETIFTGADIVEHIRTEREKVYEFLWHHQQGELASKLREQLEPAVTAAQ